MLFPCQEGSEWNRRLDAAQAALLVLFTLEMAVYAIANGALFNETHPAYMESWWSLLDLVVVVTGWVELALGSGAGLSGLRGFRALRPLRTVPSMPGLRVMVGTLLKSFPLLLDILLLLLWMFLAFGIVGMQVRRRREVGRRKEVGMMNRAKKIRIETLRDGIVRQGASGCASDRGGLGTKVDVGSDISRDAPPRAEARGRVHLPQVHGAGHTRRCVARRDAFVCS